MHVVKDDLDDLFKIHDLDVVVLSRTFFEQLHALNAEALKNLTECHHGEIEKAIKVFDALSQVQQLYAERAAIAIEKQAKMSTVLESLEEKIENEDAHRTELLEYVVTLLGNNREAVFEKLKSTVFSYLKRMPSPEEMDDENIPENLFGYWHKLKEDGYDNLLYKMALDDLEDAVYEAFQKLTDDEKRALIISDHSLYGWDYESEDDYRNSGGVHGLFNSVIKDSFSEHISELVQEVINEIPYASDVSQQY